LEEDRARREAEAKKQDDKTTSGATEQPVVDMAEAEDEIAQAIALSMNRPSNTEPATQQSSLPSFDEMSEEEQMALALSLSLQSQAEEAKATPSTAPATSTTNPATTTAPATANTVRVIIIKTQTTTKLKNN